MFSKFKQNPADGNSENKKIAIDDVAIFEMSFKNLNRTFSISKPVQNCTSQTLLLIIGIL